MKKLYFLKNLFTKNLIRNFCKKPEMDPFVQKTDFIEGKRTET